MTHDEIMKLEACPETNTLVAEKVMGWKRLIPINKDYKECVIWKTGSPYIDGTRYTFSNIMGIDTWKPSSDISAAFEAIDKIDPFDFILEHVVDDEWEASFWLKDDSSPLYVGRAPTASLAICHGLLLIAFVTK